MRKRLGEFLVEDGKIEPAKLERALRLQEKSDERIGSLLIKLGLVADREVAKHLAAQLDMPFAAPEHYPDELLLGTGVSVKFMRESQVVPIAEEENSLIVAMADPQDTFTIDALRMAWGKDITVFVGAGADIDAAITRQYGGAVESFDQMVETKGGPAGMGAFDDIQHLRDLASEAPVIRLVNFMISRALEMRASDIHIEPFENRLRIRYRVDGALRDVESPPVTMTAAVISRVKIMSNLDIAERRLPQDGRIALRIEGKDIDLRVSTVPATHGESVVLRILDRESVPLDFVSLGFSETVLRDFIRLLDLPHGIILVTGPTGSGKTTTLYAALERLNTQERKILTVEDPVEYQLDGINQIHVKPQIGLTFASALRSILRQDPDVIMVGEMRDLETAKIAVQSALTGHKVFSTLHTNDAGSSVTRLLDMGVEDYLVTSTVNGILAQRLVRKVCENCRESYTALPELVEEMHMQRYAGEGPLRCYRSRGCDHCEGTGYRGRTGVVELMVMNDALRRAILGQADAAELQHVAVKNGMQPMFGDAVRKALAGVTTMEEVVRVTTQEG